MKKYQTLIFIFSILFLLMSLSFVTTAATAGNSTEAKSREWKITKIKLKKLQQMDRTKIPILMYHHLDEMNQNALTVNPVIFEQQMELLKAKGYTTITDHDLELFYQGKKLLPDKPVMITFDDGYRSNYQYAFPTLQKLNMKGTIFLITDSIEHPEKHDSPYPKLKWDQVEEMSASGLVSFQSHTNDMHQSIEGKRNKGVILGPVNRESIKQHEKRVLTDLAVSKNLIEQHTGKPVISFSYPFGSYSSDSEKLVKQAGFKISYTTDFGYNKKSVGPYLLKRVNVHGNASADHILVLMDKILN